MTIPVVLQRLENYQPTAVNAALTELLQPLGGMQAFVQPGQKVLLKPNLLAGKPPEKAVTTHPVLVEAVVKLVQACGATPLIGDSPGIGNGLTVAGKCGILEVAERTGAEFTPFTESVPLASSGETFHRLQVARQILDADLIINLPKLKTHQMIGLTCGVKNLFGAIVGVRKPGLHLQAGNDARFFATMLLELAEQIAPALTIVDAVVGMQGNGPGSGDPVAINSLLASPSPLAVDTLATALVGMRPEQVWTQQVALDSERPGCRMEELELYGTPLEELVLTDFQTAKATDVGFGLPRLVKNRLKGSLTARTEIIEQTCQLCGDCVRHCPPEAMNLSARRVTIDHNRCIRCFCCQELCPHAAIATRQGLLLRLNQFLKGG